MRIDLHCHTEASSDCLSPLSLFPQRCREQVIHVQAITDHNEIWGAQKLQEIVAAEEPPEGADELPLTVIVGEEVSTLEGEIIGLFLKEKVPGGIPAAEAVARIKAQGALVMLPHGFDPLKRWRLRPSAREQLIENVDIVETFNARLSLPRYNRQAAQWAEAHHIAACAGTDAHRLADVGIAWTETPDRAILGPQDLLLALAEGKVVGQWTHPVLAFVKKRYDQWKYRLQTYLGKS